VNKNILFYLSFEHVKVYIHIQTPNTILNKYTVLISKINNSLPLYSLVYTYKLGYISIITINVQLFYLLKVYHNFL